MKPARRTQAQRSGATTAELVGAARKLFAERGYAATSAEDIVRAAGVTKGALYHHFTSKRDVFRAVFEAEHVRIAECARSAMAAKRPADAWRALEAACLTFLDECQHQSIRQIVLLDAPAALGWDDTREVESSHTLRVVKEGLTQAAREGTLRARSVEPLAHLVWGATREGAMAAARASEPEATAKAVRLELRRLLAALAGA